MVVFGPAEVEFFTHAFREARYVTLASFVLVLYDYVLTLGDEIRSFWTPGFSRSKALFFANRYSSIWVITLRLYSALNTSASPSLCRGLHGIISFGALVIFSSYGFVMLMRVYALYKRQITVTRVLMPIVIVLWITNLVLLIELAIRLRVDVAVQEVVGGCPISVNGGPAVTWRNYVPVLIQLTLLTGMIVYKAVQQPMASAQARDVMVLLVRDGTVVYFAGLVSILINIIGSLVSSIRIQVTTSNIPVTTFSICTSRILLNLSEHLSSVSSAAPFLQSRDRAFLSGIEMTGLYLGGYKGGIGLARGVEGATVKECGNTTVIEVPVVDHYEDPENLGTEGSEEGGEIPSHHVTHNLSSPPKVAFSALGAAPGWERWDDRVPNKELRLPSLIDHGDKEDTTELGEDGSRHSRPSSRRNPNHPSPGRRKRPATAGSMSQSQDSSLVHSPVSPSRPGTMSRPGTSSGNTEKTFVRDPWSSYGSVGGSNDGAATTPLHTRPGTSGSHGALMEEGVRPLSPSVTFAVPPSAPDTISSLTLVASTTLPSTSTNPISISPPSSPHSPRNATTENLAANHRHRSKSRSRADANKPATGSTSGG